MGMSKGNVSYNRDEMYNEMKHDFFRKISFALSIMTCLLLGVTLYVGLEEGLFYDSGIKAEGRVIGFTTELRNGREMEFPVVYYIDILGNAHSTISNLAKRYSGGHKIGDKFSIMYQNNDPGEIRENSLIGLFGKLLMVSSMTYLNFILFLISHYYLMLTPLRRTAPFNAECVL